MTWEVTSMEKYGRAFVGFLFTALGVSMMIHVNHVGLEPWPAAIMGLSAWGLTYGLWNVIIHACFISLTMLLEKRPPRLGTFLNMAIVSPLIDLFIWFDFFPEINSTVSSYLFFVFGVVITSFGLSLVITSNIGAGSKTQFYVVLHEKTNWKLAHCKNLVEFTGFLLAFLVGGPLFIGTLLFIFISSVSIEFFVSKMKKQT